MSFGRRPRALTLLLPGRSRRNLLRGGTFHGRHGSTQIGRAKEERIMKLDSRQVKDTLTQLDARVLPEDHPAIRQLCEIFGEHTFFVDDSGLKVLEPTDDLDIEPNAGEVISIADWSDPTATSLRAHDPEPTGVVVVFDKTRH
jgi:hypothetical protein